MGAPPSTASPRALTTRPKKARPTGMPATLPVRRTVLPCMMSASSPKITQPISSSFKSRIMPFKPFSNTRISPYSALGRPLTVAMPSPTVSTVPTCSPSGLGVKFCTASRIIGITLAFLLIAARMDCLSWRLRPSGVQSKISAKSHLYTLVPTSIRKPSATVSSFFQVMPTSFWYLSARNCFNLSCCWGVGSCLL